MTSKTEEFAARMGYRFNDTGLLLEALRHSSYTNEQPEIDLRNNERLEFLGDAVLSLAVAHILMERYPDLREGDFSRIRAGIVSAYRLAQVARKLTLGDCIALGKGEVQSDGREKDSILADALEAVLAAVYLDSDFDTALGIVRNHFSHLIDSDITAASGRDYKSQLQEWSQANMKVTPRYRVVGEKGPDHNKTFTVELQMRDVSSSGTGKSKKDAEQNAAREALLCIKSADTDGPEPGAQRRL